MITKQGVQQETIPLTRVHWLLAVAFGLLFAPPGIPAHAASMSKDRLPPEVVSFIKEEEIHARALAKKLDLKVSPDVWDFFRTAQTGTTAATTNAFNRLSKRAGQHDPTVSTPVWRSVMEVILAVEAFEDGVPDHSLAFGKGVINSIPPGSIYFGGHGSGPVTALSKSHAKGDPFFIITQNALIDGRYLEYLRATYGDKIRTPTTNESSTTLAEYLADAQKRLDHDRRFPAEPRQIKPGEDIGIVDNRAQVSSHVSVMAVNALLAKMIFDANPDREFYIEESFPLDWMYPYLVPHGWIFRLNREPLAALPDEAVRKDREFWTRQQTQVIGDWLTPDTPVKDVCDFVLKRFGRKDFSGFEGDRRFVENSYATRRYSKLRSAIGGLYNWRLSNSKSPEEQKRMTAEADFALRQAFALCPSSPEVVFRYVNLLVTADRLEDALRVVRTAQSLDPENALLESVIAELNRQNRAKDK